MTRPDERSSHRLSIAPWNFCGMRATIFPSGGFRYGGNVKSRLPRGMGELAGRRTPGVPKLNHYAIKSLVVAKTSMR